MKCLELVTKLKVYTFEEYSNQNKILINSAKKSALDAYAPYSNYKVGAAVLLENGSIVTGNNQENAAYPSGLCAERTALFYANASYPNEAIVAIAIVAYHKNKYTNNVCSPCGACRQVLAEIETRFKKPITIIMCGSREIYEVGSIRDLLPLMWDSNQLE